MSLLQVSILCATIFAAQTVLAQADESDRLARQAFAAGSGAFEEGDYETALLRFQEAYELSHRPELLYNIAQSLDRMRRDEEALAALRDYLEAAPDTRSRTEVEARITVLQRAVDQRHALEAEAHRRQEEAERRAAEGDRLLREQRDRQASAPPSRPPLHPALFITVAALALGGGGVAVWTGVETLSLNKAYNASTDLDEARRLYRETEIYQTTTNVLIFSAAGLAAASLVMAIFTDWGGGTAESPPSAWVTPTFELGPNGASLGAAGSF